MTTSDTNRHPSIVSSPDMVSRLGPQKWLRLLPFIVFLIGTSITVLMSSSVQDKNQALLQKRFDQLSGNLAREVNDKTNSYVQVLRGLSGLFASSQTVEYHEFQLYLQQLHLEQNFPDILGIRYIQIVSDQQKAAYQDKIRQAGTSDYFIWPEGQRPLYAPVVYVAPESQLNLETLGYDMFSDGNSHTSDYGGGPRGLALAQARDLGDIVVTDRLTLHFKHAESQRQDNAFAVFLPLYRQGENVSTLAARKKHIVGWLAVVFRTETLMRSIMADQHGAFDGIDAHLYDGKEAKDSHLLFDADPSIITEKSLFRSQHQISLGGHQWLLSIASTPDLEHKLNSDKVELIGVAGSVATILVSLLIWAVVRGRERERESLSALAREGRKYEAIMRAASDGVCVFDKQGKVVQVNLVFADIVGYSLEELAGMDVGQWLVEFDVQALVDTVQALNDHSPVLVTQFRHKNGRWIDVEMSLSCVILDEQQLIYSAVRDITARKKNEELLRITEERWALALEGSGAGVWDWNIQTGQVLFSRYYMEMLGYAGNEAWDCLEDWKEHVNAEDLRRAMMALEAHMDGKTETYAAEYRMLCRDDSWKWVAARGRIVLRGVEDRPMRMLGTHTDITASKLAEQALADSESRMRLLLDSAAEAIYGVDLEGVCTFCNPACVRLLGYEDARQLIGIKIHSVIRQRVINDAATSEPACEIQHSMETGEELHSDNEVFWRADGVPICVEYWSHPQIHQGRVVGAVITFLDITERKRINEHLVKLSRAVEDSPASVVITDINGAIEYVNHRFTQLTGYLPEEALGKNPRILNSGLHSRDFFRGLWATLNAGSVWEGEIYNRKKNGEVYLEHSTIAPIRDDQGVLTHFVSVREDITERKRIEDALQHSMKMADEANRAKSLFLANMSHEIRTPMNAIIGLVHLCLQTGLTAKQTDYLHKVHAAANTLLGIVNDILDLSKIEAGKLDVEKNLFLLDDVLSNVVTVIANRAEEKGLELLLQTDMNVPRQLMGDSLRLGQILINLMSNAVKFTDHGEILLLTELKKEEDDYLVLSFTVRDTGIGLSQEQQTRLFQAFTQADSSTTRKYGGTGLGLTISKQLVELMGGQIFVSSQLNVGSEFAFTIRLPKINQTTPLLPSAPLDLSGLRVLAVDDNATCRHIIKTYLDALRLNVSLVDSGELALTAIRDAQLLGQDFQLILLDWRMPIMDGVETAKQIRQLSDVPILLNSGFSRSEMACYLEQGIVDGVLAKPFTCSSLLDAMLGVLGYAHFNHSAKQAVSNQLFLPEDIEKIKGACLLLVEDNLINQQVASELLQRAGISVVVANHGRDALDKLARQPFDGILMDMQMPVMDGVAATRAIRQQPQYANLPIIAMTANVMESDKEECLKAGMNDYLQKPLEPLQLGSTLAKWITPSGTEIVVEALITDNDSLPVPVLTGVQVVDGLRRMGGSLMAYYQVLEKFAHDQATVVIDIRRALLIQDDHAAVRLAHTLKGLLGTIGADGLCFLTKELEAAIRGGETVLIESRLKVLDSELSLLFAEIRHAAGVVAAQAKVDHRLLEPLDLDMLKPLLLTAKQQLAEFDSEVDLTIKQIAYLTKSDPLMSNSLSSICHFVASYDYDTALQELNKWIKQSKLFIEDES